MELCKLKSAAKNNTGTTIRITKKNFQDKELPTRQEGNRHDKSAT